VVVVVVVVVVVAVVVAVAATKMVLEMLLQCRRLMWLIAQEDFIERIPMWNIHCTCLIVTYCVPKTKSLYETVPF
jgi:hypothetical protein